jgi:hypothetical protein
MALALFEKIRLNIWWSNKSQSQTLRGWCSRGWRIAGDPCCKGPCGSRHVSWHSRTEPYGTSTRTACLVDRDHPFSAVTTCRLLHERRFGIGGKNQPALARPSFNDDARVGHNAPALLGCTSIGRVAIIGAGAMVACDVPARRIAAGLPSRSMHGRFDGRTIAPSDVAGWWKRAGHGRAALVRAHPGPGAVAHGFAVSSAS